MAGFRKTIALISTITTLILFISCASGEADTQTSDYANNAENNNTYDNTAERTEISDSAHSAAPAAPMPFTGEPVPRSQFFWQDGRNQDRESDIRHFAVKALRLHPLLTDFDTAGNQVFGIEAVREAYAADAYDILLQRAILRNGILADDSIDVMREAFREFFINKVNELILDIPNLNDNEALFGLAAIAALLDDAHTRVGLPMGDVFPAQFLALYDGIYFIGVPKEAEHALYSELIAINGIDINEIIERLGRIIPHENEYHLRRVITQEVSEDPVGLRHYVVRPFLKELITLNYLSVIDDSGRADFTVRATAGEIFDIQLEAVNREAGVDEVSFVHHKFSTIMHENPEEVFWHEYFPGENLMYVRIRGFSYRYSELFLSARHRLTAELTDWPEGEKIESFVIDLRQNPGGLFEWPTISDFPLLSEVSESLYVIIDAGKFSMGVITASNIIHSMENVTIIGEPTGQIDNMFAGDASTLPNSRMRYNISHRMWAGSNSDDIAIRPDVFIPLTIEDVMNNRDPVFGFIVN